MRTFALMACILVAGGCATKPPAPAARTNAASEERLDETIGREVRYRLQTQCPAEATAIQIVVSDATVTLRGVVPTHTAAWRAQAAATAVPGVKAVRNELQVLR